MRDAFQIRTVVRMRVKILDGATYAVVKRKKPSADQWDYYWLGDNGREIELSDGERAEFLQG